MLPCEIVLKTLASTFGYAGFVLYNGLDRDISRRILPSLCIVVMVIECINLKKKMF